jgi:hypothetical protein
MQSRLGSNSWSSCLSLLSAGITAPLTPSSCLTFLMRLFYPWRVHSFPIASITLNGLNSRNYALKILEVRCLLLG